MITNEHLESLKNESGISLAALVAAKVESFTAEESLIDLGVFKSGLAFNYFRRDGSYIHTRLRKDHVEPDEGRYHQPRGSACYPYFILENVKAIFEPDLPLVLLEGEKKLLSFYSNLMINDSFRCGVVACSGCYGFLSKDENGDHVLFDDFDEIPVNGRKVILIPDTDYFLNSDVKRAYDKLISLLLAKNATIELVDCRLTDEDKIGVDEFIVQNGVNQLRSKIQKPQMIFEPSSNDETVDVKLNINLPLNESPHLEVNKMPEMTGYMKVLYDWILDTSPIKQPILTYGTVIAIIGTVLTNLYRFVNSNPVFYIMFVSRSGSGKDRPLKVPKVIFSDEFLKEYIGFAGYRSDAAIIDTLPDQRSRLDLLDEVDGVFKISKSDNGYQSGIVNILTELWSESNKYYPGRRTKTTGVLGNCWNPCVNILSALTPTAFRENFTKSMMLTGFGGRFLYFIANDNFEYTDNFVGTDMNNVSEEILLPLRHWHSLKKYDAMEKRFSIQSLGIKPEAKVLLNRIRKEYYEASMKLDEEDPLSPIAQRMYEYLERLVIVHTCAQDPFKPSPIIEVSNVEWCKSFVEFLFENNKFFISNNVASSYFELMKSKILQPIAKAKAKGISHSRLLKNSHLKAKELAEIIRTLEESGLISIKEIKKRKIYFYTGKQ